MLKAVGCGWFMKMLIISLWLVLLAACTLKKATVTSKEPGYMLGKAPGLAEAKVLKITRLKESLVSAAFKQVLSLEKETTGDVDWLRRFYKNQDYELILLNRYLPGKDLELLMGYLDSVELHGLNPELFYRTEIRDLWSKLGETKEEKTMDAYQQKVKLEVLLAVSLIKYSRTMQYGLVRPDSIYTNYFISTLSPDSSLAGKVFAVADLKNYLDSIQPKSSQYLALQKALKLGFGTKAIPREEADLVIKVNLERLRWKNKVAAVKYVSVNIPDFSLEVIDQGKAILQMKVCVGEGRNKDGMNLLSKDPDTGLVRDQPIAKETPQLNSMIYSVQVNPIWHIPASIARAEISKYVASNPDYLAENDMDVYKDGKRISAGEVDWENVGQYSFKQRPGDQNSLGKIKFLFNNNSSVYLHDTPVKSAFKKVNRAISHGCVRVEKPLELALALFGKGKTYDQIKSAMQNAYPRAKNISLPVKIPVYLNYITAWADAKGNLALRKDIYGLDLVLYSYMKNHHLLPLNDLSSANN
ncbi:L,D-transpeptidase scaffold domain-containing protein [Pedobacter caeni]|nr:L,D-transpeptidase family protein [Pedobacter caeni]